MENFDETTQKRIALIKYEVQRFFASKGMNSADAARQLGITAQSLSNQLSRPITHKCALRYKQQWPEINIDFLLTGVGSLLGQQTGTTSQQCLGDYRDFEIARLKDECDRLRHDYEKVKDENRQLIYTIRNMSEASGNGAALPLKKDEFYLHK